MITNNRHVDFWTPVLLISGALMLLLALVMSHVAHAAAVTTDGAPGYVTLDTGWSLVQQYGPVWGGMALAFALASALLKRNESEHWIAQGRTLAILVAAVGTGTAALSARFAGTPWSGVLVTAVVSLFKLLQPTVGSTGAPPRDPEAGHARLLVLVILTGVTIGAASQALWLSGCATAKQAPGAAKHAIVDCTRANAAAILAEVAEYGAAAIATGHVDWSAVEAAATKQGVAVGGCAVSAFVAALAKRAPADVAARSTGPDLVADGRATLERLRVGWGGCEWIGAVP